MAGRTANENAPARGVKPRMAQTLQWPSQEVWVDAAAFRGSRQVLDVTQGHFSLRHRFVVPALSAAVQKADSWQLARR
jgi:hypothetical protein